MSALPPQGLLALLDAHGYRFKGWYAESAEGVMAAYDESPEVTLELVEAMWAGEREDG